MNKSEKNLLVIDNINIFKKIVNFFKSIFKTDKTNYVIESNPSNTEDIHKDDFINSIKFSKDPDEEKLLKIQDELEKIGINQENAYMLTKDLSDSQKIKLENLYKTQIKNYENSIEFSKNKIINIRKKLA